MDLLNRFKLHAQSLHGPLNRRVVQDSAVLRLTHDVSAENQSHAIILTGSEDRPHGSGTYFVKDRALDLNATGVFLLPDELHYLSEGDIVRVNFRQGEVWVMYRQSANTNSMLLTERCNSFCVMCSQPPKRRDDSELIRAWLTAIPLMSPESQEIGMTGGEPLLLGDDFLALVDACKKHLPQTALHVLSNGRLFNYLTLARKLADVNHPNLMIGIPLYSDIAWRHEYTVQSPGAFDQTIRGILNLARCGVRIEIRVVIHRQTVDRLPDLAKFIARNFPFVEHVALMGLEPIGFARRNLSALWIDPFDYQAALMESVNTLSAHNLQVSVYNHQLCILPESVWPYARQSISDWKNIYLPTCESCLVREECGGFFHSATDCFSSHIAPVLGKHSIIGS